MARILPFFTIILFLICINASAAEHGDKKTNAESAALAWLSIVDSGKYNESWNEASGIFKNAVTKKQWDQSLKAVRSPLGKTISRTVKSADYKTSLPGAPDGDYVVIQFRTSFENKKSAIETVTPMMDTDGRWRVSGYYIN